MILGEYWNEEKTKNSKVHKRDHSYMIELYHNDKLLGRIATARAAKAEDLAEDWVLDKLNLQEVTKK